ncbi:hypothetical protein E6W39_19080 [Kitasatospora acidiphila]|uniref:Uncharacterized protein n=1 Tax=Kitasatospora acidiphila TaxID=2567942 RepID=A0A540W4L8_9ACTN|nr:hypothetical protein [Kitasatospora acidiphila]TQF03956.1 hypothetical protein E6W39_19080 [Kitasatospora acidiphila]
MITIALFGDNLTTADLGWFREAVHGASGHSGNDYPIEIVDGVISVEIPGEEEEPTTPERPLKVGDMVRVLGDHPSRSRFEKGEIVEIVVIESENCVQAEGVSGRWWMKAADFERVTD